MSDFFFRLPEEERREVIQRASVESGMPEDVLEKDIWLVWTLHRLFAIPDIPDMAFKGGTALSKVFGAIERFSEDVDVSVNYKALLPELAEVDLSTLSRSAKKKASDRLRARLNELAHETIVPQLQSAAAELCGDGYCEFEIDDTGENIRLRYPSVAAKAGYLREGILIELGGRNPTEPNQPRLLETEISRFLPQFEWPIAQVTVLAPTRTFWEKATLIHIACNRPEGRIADRMFRHWYDLAKLAEHEIGTAALENIPLLERVVRHKEAFFAYADVGYEACLDGGMLLVPPAKLIDALHADYRGMVGQRMFGGALPEFDAVIQRIGDLQSAINRAVQAFYSS